MLQNKNFICLFIINVCNIIHELYRCVTELDRKGETRYMRLNVCAIVLRGAPYPRSIIHPQAKTCDPSVEDLIRALTKQRESGNVTVIGNSLIFKKGDRQCPMKQFIEDKLTKEFHSRAGLVTYHIATGVVYDMWRELAKDKVLCELIHNRRIMIVLKGGIAARISLLEYIGCELRYGKITMMQYMALKNMVEIGFALGGDNDTSIIIDPRMGRIEHDRIRQLCSTLSRKYLETRIADLSVILNSYADDIKEVKLLDNFRIEVNHTQRKSFELRTGSDGSVKLTTFGTNKLVFLSDNDNILINNPSGTVNSFELLRLKIAFFANIGNTNLSAEFLDISIPKFDDNELRKEFHLYQSGEYANVYPIVTNCNNMLSVNVDPAPLPNPTPRSFNTAAKPFVMNNKKS